MSARSLKRKRRRPVTIAGTYSNLNYHLVFSTKHPENYIDDLDFERRLHEYFGGIVRQSGGIPYLINGTEDHVRDLDYIKDIQVAATKALSYVENVTYVEFFRNDEKQNACMAGCS